MQRGKPRILLVEDDRLDLMAFERYVSQEEFPYDYSVATCAAEAIRMLGEENFAAIVTDYLLGDGTAFDVMEASGQTPVVFVTGTGDEATAVRAMKQGAHDYLIKDLDGHYLKTIAVTVEGAIHLKQIEEQLHEHQANLEHLVEKRTQELRESEQRYRLLADNVLDMISRLTPDGTFLYVSPASQTLLGYIPEQLVGRAIDDIAHPDDVRFLQECQSALEAGASSHLVTYRMMKGDGAYVWVEMVVRAMRDEASNALQEVIAVTRDITERRQMEAREEEVRLRAQEQERLAAIGQLAAGIAHDFNNLLTGIIGYSQLMLHHDGVSEQIASDAQVISEQGRRAAEMIRQILDFSRQSLQHKQLLDLWSFLKEQVKLLQRTIPESVRIELEPAEGRYLVSADITQMQQVLTNLAVNARDAMPDGGTLRISLTHRHFSENNHAPFPEMASRDWLLLSVRDTGTGMSEEIRAHIFEPFFTTKEVGRGTGLGLAQVHGIVSQHGGFIDVESRVGRGTTFHVYLPPDDISSELSDTTLTLTYQYGNQEGILLVDDEATVVNTIERMATSLHYQVFSASDGAQALELYESHSDAISLLVTDAVMPGMSGHELIRTLRQRCPDLKVVLMSGYMLETQETFDDIDGWLAKPPTFGQLSEVLWQAIHS